MSDLARDRAVLDAGQQILREQNRRLAATYEQATIGIAEIDAQGRRLRVNEAACAITGRSRAELIGGSVFNVLHPEDRNDDIDQYQRLVAGEVDRYSIEKRIVRKNGSVIWVAVTCSSVRDAAGNFEYGLRIFEDITERKIAEQRLRERERQLRELLEGLPAAVYATDTRGQVTFYNQAVVELSGHRPELGSDQWPAGWPLYRPDGTPLPHDQSPMAVALRENRPVRGAEAVAERPDGTRVPFIPYPTPLHDASGTLIGAVNVLVDVSERKQAETAQKVLLDELNHRVKNNMQMLHSLLRAAQRQTDSAEAQVVLADASQRIAAMAAAQQVLYDADHPTNYDTKHFIAAVCSTAKQSLGKTIDIAWDACTAELPNDTAMPLALILNELLTNAAKHGTKGREGASIKVGLTRSLDAFVLHVEDDGEGFDLDKVRKRSSGLGLVTGLARQLGGTFSVERTPGARCVVQFLDQKSRNQ